MLVFDFFFSLWHVCTPACAQVWDVKNALTRPQQDADGSKNDNGRQIPPKINFALSPTPPPPVAPKITNTHQPTLFNKGVGAEQQSCRTPNSSNERSGALEGSGMNSAPGYADTRIAHHSGGGWGGDDMSTLTKQNSGGSGNGDFFWSACDGDDGGDEERDGVSELQQSRSSKQPNGIARTCSSVQEEDEAGSRGAGEGYDAYHPGILATAAGAGDDSSNSEDGSKAPSEEDGGNGVPGHDEDDRDNTDDDEEGPRGGGETNDGAASTRNWRSVNDNCWTTDFSDASIDGEQLGDR